MEQFFTVTRAAEMLGVSRRRVHQLIEAGLLTEVGRAGRVVLLARAEVERLSKVGWPGQRRKDPGDRTAD